MGNPDPLPSLPTTGLWTGQTVGNPSPVMSIPAQAGPNTWRVIAETVTVQDPTTLQDSTAILMVAEDLGNLNALTTRLVLFDLIVGGAIVVVLAAVGVGVVRANLRPLDDIELTAGQIAAGHLDHRVPEGDPRTEIGSLGRSLNAMLSQIERAFHAQGQAEQAAHQSEERMRRFVADAAHELRTPLTTIRGFAAHYRQRGGASRIRWGAPEQNSSSRTDAADSGPATASPVAVADVRQDGMSPEDLDHLVGRVEAEAARMGLLVEDLLTLARLDQQRPLAKAPVDLLTLAADAVQDARIVSPGRPIDLIVAPGTAFLVDGDEPRLRQVIANLVNNAITHTPAGTPVRVKIGRGTLEAQPTDRADRAGEQDGWGGSASAADASRAVGREVPAVVLDVEDDGPGMTRGSGAARLRAVLPSRRGTQPSVRRDGSRSCDRGRDRLRARRHGLGGHGAWAGSRLPGQAAPLPRRAGHRRRRRRRPDRPIAPLSEERGGWPLSPGRRRCLMGPENSRIDCFVGDAR